MKARTLLGIVVGGVGLVAGSGLAVWLVLWVGLRTSAVRVPDVRGIDPPRAVAHLQSSGLVARLQDGVFDREVPAGRISRQRPAPGFELKRGATVLLYPSLGEAAQKVGDLVNMPVSMAEAEIEDEKLVVGRRCDVDGQADSVTVIAQSPAAGTLVAPGSEVALLVNRSLRERRYVMPDFVGADQDDAARVIGALGFRLAQVQRVPYPGIRPAVVLRQDPQAGGPVSESAVVALWVSQ